MKIKATAEVCSFKRVNNSKIKGLKQQTEAAMVGKCYVIEPPKLIDTLKDKEGAAWEKNVAGSLHGPATWADKWLYKGPLLSFILLLCQKKPWDREINVKAAFVVHCSVLKSNSFSAVLSSAVLRSELSLSDPNLTKEPLWQFIASVLPLLNSQRSCNLCRSRIVKGICEYSRKPLPSGVE